MTLPDARALGFAVMGDLSGRPLVVLHGTPGSARQLGGLDERARDHGIALIAPDRAGYGGSDYDPRRTIGSGAHDIGSLLEHLDIASCAVVGLSGGGPTALACGVLLESVVTKVATVGGVAPLLPRDPLLPPGRLLLRTARHSEPAARFLFEVIVRTAKARPEQVLARFARLLAESDQRVLLEDAQIRSAFLDDLRHPSDTAARAAAHDFSLFARRWDIDLGQLVVPTHIWHGTADRNVPVAHAKVLASKCPTAEIHLVQGGGHLLLGELERIIAELAPG